MSCSFSLITSHVIWTPWVNDPITYIVNLARYCDCKGQLLLFDGNWCFNCLFFITIFLLIGGSIVTLCRLFRKSTIFYHMTLFPVVLVTLFDFLLWLVLAAIATISLCFPYLRPTFLLMTLWLVNISFRSSTIMSSKLISLLIDEEWFLIILY